MSRRTVRLAGLAGALLALGCASLRGLPGEPDLEKTLRSRGLDPAAVIVPFAITDEMRAWVHAQVPPRTVKEDRLDLLLAALVAPDRLQLTYEPGHTGTAREVFETRRANCLAFTSLFVGLARELGVPAFYLDVEDIEKFEKDGDLMVVSGHVSAGHDFGGGKVKILDFSPTEQPVYRRVHRITDVRAVAVFYSNRGAESLRAGHSGEAVTWLRKAVEIDPEFGGAWVNLGVALRREGDVPGAEAAYRKALEVDPSTSSAYSNLASLLRSRGRDAEAAGLLGIAANLDSRNPFSFLALGDLSMSQGRLEEARRYYRQALRLNSEDAEAYAALGLVALAAGNVPEANKWLHRAEARDRASERVRRLGSRLAGAAPATRPPRAEGR